jgi:hypothetical protein
MLVRTTLIAAAIATAALAMAGLGPSLAHADVDDVDGYVAVLNHEGIDTSARAAVIHMGREVCNSFDHGLTLNQVLSAISAGNTDYTNDEAQWIVAASVTKLCPNHQNDFH